MSDQVVNRVAASGLITIDLEEYYEKGERVIYDIKQNLYEELLLKEKDFRLFIKEHDWSVYKGKNVGIVCTADAIVPIWAYMLLVSRIEAHANIVIFGDLEQLECYLFQRALTKIDPKNYINEKVVVKGCGNLPIPIFAYGELTRILSPVVQSIMYGEPCSTVPILKNNK